MNPTRCLRDEHQQILKVLDCFEIALSDAHEVGATPRVAFQPFVDFFRGFADRCHHCKEEDRLFPCLERKGIPREGGPIGVMLHEHEQARRHVATIAEHLELADAGDASAVNTVLRHGKEYLDLLRDHINKEDHCLFGMADQLIQGSDLTALTGAYEEAKAEAEYNSTETRCLDIANTLMAKYGVASP